MKPLIDKFLRKACKRYKLSASYVAQKDMYMIHKDGKVVYAFYGYNFTALPMRQRFFEILPMMKVGLNNNLGEKYYEQSFRPKHGQSIC